MMARSRAARIAAAALMGTAASVATAATAVAAPPAAEQSQVQAAAAWGPNSLRPGIQWFWGTRYPVLNNCQLATVILVSNGSVSGATCSIRFDGLGWDLWLRN